MRSSSRGKDGGRREVFVTAGITEKHGVQSVFGDHPRLDQELQDAEQGALVVVVNLEPVLAELLGARSPDFEEEPDCRGVEAPRQPRSVCESLLEPHGARDRRPGGSATQAAGKLNESGCDPCTHHWETNDCDPQTKRGHFVVRASLGYHREREEETDGGHEHAKYAECHKQHAEDRHGRWAWPDLSIENPGIDEATHNETTDACRHPSLGAHRRANPQRHRSDGYDEEAHREDAGVPLVQMPQDPPPHAPSAAVNYVFAQAGTELALLVLGSTTLMTLRGTGAFTVALPQGSGSEDATYAETLVASGASTWTTSELR